jgi:hypothetical protein
MNLNYSNDRIRFSGPVTVLDVGQMQFKHNYHEKA